MQIDICFIFYFVPEDQKTIFASTFLRDRTQHWLKPALRKYIKNLSENSNAIFTSFNNFKRELRRIFGISNKKQIAERVI